MNPNEYKERVLLAITGLSPQVVTETLYALTQNQKPAFLPTRIVVISTADGADRARLELLSKDRAWFHKLRADYELPDIRFDEKDIRIIKGVNGEPLHDIRNPEQNTCVANQVSDIVRELALDDDTAIHASIAGGRKSMGFYLGYAMSLYGRPQDRLSHVLVDEGYEGHPDFFYPTVEGRVIHTRDNKPLDTSKAGVMLADIPFVRLRDGLPGALLDGESSFSDTIEAAQRMYQSPELLMDISNQTVVCSGMELKLSPVPFALYLTMAERALSEKELVVWACEEFKAEFLEALGKITPSDSGTYEGAEESVEKGFEQEYFAPHVSKIKTELKELLSAKGAEPYLIHSYGKRGEKRYGLALNAEQVRIER